MKSNGIFEEWRPTSPCGAARLRRLRTVSGLEARRRTILIFAGAASTRSPAEELTTEELAELSLNDGFTLSGSWARRR
jgi:hypothetical protein